MGRAWISGSGRISIIALVLSLATCSSEQQLAVGERVQFTVKTGGKGVQDLADVGRGFCRYVVIVDPACSACQSAKSWWEDELQRGVVELPSQDVWRVMWAVASPGTAWGGDIAAEIQAVEIVDTRRAMERLGLTAVPAYLIMDTEGKLVDAGFGARLPRSSAFRTDCTIQSAGAASIHEVGG